MSIQIPGQPEGIEVIRFGICGPDDYELTSEGISKGPRQGSTSQIIVKPAKGYKFVFDPAAYRIYAVMELNPPEEVKRTFTFTVHNTREREIANGLLDDWDASIKKHWATLQPEPAPEEQPEQPATVEPESKP